MAIDTGSAPIEVNENSNPGQLGQAALKYGATIAGAEVNHTAVLTEQRSLQAGDGNSGGSGILNRANSSGDSLASAQGNTEAGLYGDLATNKLLPSLEMAGMGLKLLTEGTDSAAGYGGQTFDRMIKEGAAKPTLGGKKGGIVTEPFNKTAAIEGRVDGVRDFMTSPLKGAKATTAVTLSNQLTKTMTAKIVNEQNLAITKNLEQGVVGAKVMKARMAGIDPMALNHSGMGSGPKFVEPKEEVVDESATSWA